MGKESAKNWYVFDGGRVLGPFKSIEIQKLISEGLSADSLIWDGSSSNWTSILTWNLQHPISPTSQEAWYFSVDGIQTGTFTLKEISEKILNKEVPLNARFWTAGFMKWMTLSELPQVVEGAGLLKRNVPRAPFVADIKVRGIILETPIGATTLSEGGIGLQNLLQLGVGAKIGLTIISDLLQMEISARATILHQNGTSSSLKFEDLSESSRECILNYISKFKAVSELTLTG